MMLPFDAPRERIAEAVRRLRPRQVAPAALAGPALLVVASDGRVVFPILAIGLFVGLVLFCANEFLILTRASDGAFPGRFDKLIWALLPLFLPPIGAPLFRAFRELEWLDDRPRSKPWPGDGL